MNEPRSSDYFHSRRQRERIASNHGFHHGAVENLTYTGHLLDFDTKPGMWTEEDATRYHFSTLLKRATYLHGTTVKLVATSLSYIDILTIMSERSDLRKDYTIMENELDKFINYEDKFVD